MGFYSRAQREVRGSDLDVNPAWRPEQTMAVHSGWLHAILAGHTRVAAGLHIDAPVCVLLSEKSAVPTRWSEELTRADTVLVVDDIARASLRLGDSVTVERIPGALHDIFLSRADARDIAYERMDRWVMGSLGTKRLPLAPGILRLSCHDLQKRGRPGWGRTPRHVAPPRTAEAGAGIPAESERSRASPTRTPAAIAHPNAPPAADHDRPGEQPEDAAVDDEQQQRRTAEQVTDAAHAQERIRPLHPWTVIVRRREKVLLDSGSRST